MISAIKSNVTTNYIQDWLLVKRLNANNLQTFNPYFWYCIINFHYNRSSLSSCYCELRIKLEQNKLYNLTSNAFFVCRNTNQHYSYSMITHILCTSLSYVFSKFNLCFKLMYVLN